MSNWRRASRRCGLLLSFVWDDARKFVETSLKVDDEPVIAFLGSR